MGENDTWGNGAEIDFVKGIGEHSERGRIMDRPKVWWLRKYIGAHQFSSLPHHVLGVGLARQLLKARKSPGG